MRVIHVAAAQMGPIQKADSREAVVKRMIALMDEAKAGGADLIILSGARADHVFSALVHGGSGRGGWLVRAGDAERGEEVAVQARRCCGSVAYAQMTRCGSGWRSARSGLDWQSNC